jgi:hypothetical protein
MIISSIFKQTQETVVHQFYFTVDHVETSTFRFCPKWLHLHLWEINTYKQINFYSKQMSIASIDRWWRFWIASNELSRSPPICEDVRRQRPQVAPPVGKNATCPIVVNS